MVDTHTRRLVSPVGDAGFAHFSARQRAALVVLSGDSSGSEFTLDQAKISIGRGPEADLAFTDTAMSREHAILEFSDGGFRIRDLGSTNGTLVNDELAKVWNLEHGDRITIGEHTFQFVLEQRELEPMTYVLPDA
jgi:pSer/pThr/pTyr-binding forkhead associated (FHA) protein